MLEINTNNKRKNYITPKVRFEVIEEDESLLAGSPTDGTGNHTGDQYGNETGDDGFPIEDS